MERSETEARGAEHPEDALLAVDLMTEDPRIIRAGASVADAMEVLEQLDIRHLPVTDDDGNLIGMLSDRDLRPLLGERDEEDPVRRARTLVSDLMTGNVVSVTTDTEIGEIIELMLDNKIGAVPVVDGEGHVVGIVSYVDILRTLIE